MTLSNLHLSIGNIEMRFHLSLVRIGGKNVSRVD